MRDVKTTSYDAIAVLHEYSDLSQCMPLRSEFWHMWQQSHCELWNLALHLVERVHVTRASGVKKPRAGVARKSPARVLQDSIFDVQLLYASTDINGVTCPIYQVTNLTSLCHTRLLLCHTPPAS